ncbi:MAG: bifunctional nicotinamide-nucleotide adenylyltransferase/Nudix hydroxylase [Acidobacteria bacterium]|nr:bifunctional nicotinamide-nucleotide adenylyltransferase/Nudix hydroxylase [Acidobacteriota bacterium]
MRKYQYAIVIGRFQPLHLAHQDLIEYSLTLAERVIVILGSARSAPDVKNPFTPSMREEIIRACFPADAGRLVFRAVRDYPYNDHVWTTEVQNVVNETTDYADARVALVGFFKDKSSYYLNLFPQWDFEEFYCADKKKLALNATAIRDKYFAEDDEWRDFVSPAVARYLDAFRRTDYYPNLRGEFEYLKKYREDTQFKGVPYKPVFLTTDAVVVQSGHILVIRRGFQPGRGLLALPGGFLAENMTLEDSAIKELKEETQIRVPVPVLRGSIRASHVFDYPERSLRGRTVTFAYHIELEPNLKEGLPRVKGGDDAKKAFWLPLSALGEKEDEFFEDHIHIIRYFLGL